MRVFYKCTKDLLKNSSFTSLEIMLKTHATVLNGYNQTNIIEYDENTKRL